MNSQREELLLGMFHRMKDTLGASGWWPAQSPFEVAIGAILTQNTSWRNVEKAVDNLRNAGVLEERALYNLPLPELTELIRPAGFFRVKAARIKHFLDFLSASCQLDFGRLSSMDLERLRPQLLAVSGIGQETADSILLYALHKPTFVVDNYTRRLAHRHWLVEEDISYNDLRAFYMEALPRNTELFNEYHALIVRVGKQWCRKQKAFCADCPLNIYLENGKTADG